MGSNAGVLTPWTNTAPSADTATFGVSGGGIASTVTFGEAIQVNRINFLTANYVIEGGGFSLNLNGSTPTIDNSIAATINAPIAGTGGVTKTGSSDLRFGKDNSGLSGTINVSQGRIFLNQDGTNAALPGGSAAASWNIASGASVLVNSNSGSSIVKTVSLGALSGDGILRNGGNGGQAAVFAIGALNSDTIFGGTMVNGPTTLTTAIQKVGTGSLTLTNGASTYSGNGTTTFATLLSAGTLAIGANSVFTGSTLTSGPLGIGQVDLRGNATTVLRAADATARTIGNALTLSNSLIFGSVGTGDLTFTGTMNTGAGAKTLTINNSVTTFSGVISGASATNVHTKAGTGTMVLSGANTTNKGWVISAGMLRLAPAAGGNNIAASTTITVHGGATFDVSGVPAGFTAATGQALRGNGSIAGPLTLGAGSTISPGAGTVSVGAIPPNATGQLTTAELTWGPGGNYQWDINDAVGSAGSTTAGYDKLVTGALTVTSDSTTPFVIKVTSLTAAQAAGLADNFNPNVSQSWVIAGTTGISGTVGSSTISIDTSGFTNAFQGTFGVSSVGNDVVLNYVVPEPGSLGLASLALVGLLRRRRNR